MSELKEEFYVGYMPTAPKGLARFLKVRIAGLLFLVLLVGAGLTALQTPFSKAVFEFGELHSFEGIIEMQPYPTLAVPRVGGGVSRYLLTVFGKHGAESEVAAFQGKRVKLDGTLIYRDAITMVEIADGTLELVEGGPALPMPKLLHEATVTQTLVGEIVDSKCFLGVMKPGNLKPHRACATRCISGGVPPVLLVRDEMGHASYYLLTSPEGGAANQDIIRRNLVAEPIRITGEVQIVGDRKVLRADPETYTRLP